MENLFGGTPLRCSSEGALKSVLSDLEGDLDCRTVVKKTHRNRLFSSDVMMQSEENSPFLFCYPQSVKSKGQIGRMQVTESCSCKSSPFINCLNSDVSVVLLV